MEEFIIEEIVLYEPITAFKDEPDEPEPVISFREAPSETNPQKPARNPNPMIHLQVSRPMSSTEYLQTRRGRSSPKFVP